jgi:glycosyltransferase involved in cell wall biosynthesis
MIKKILIFSLAYYPKHIGGAEVAIKEITDRLPQCDYEFHLICNRYDSTLPKTEQIGNVVVHRIGVTTKNPSMGDLRRWPLHFNKLLYQYLAYRTACRLHEHEHFSAIWAMMAHATGVPAALFKRRYPQVPYVLTLQEGDPPAHIERTMRRFGRLWREAFSRADMVQAISTFLAEWATERGFTKQPIVIPNAVDVAHFSRPRSPALREHTRTTLGLTADDIALVTTSRLVAKNGIDTVIDALQHLPEHMHFVVCGVGPLEKSLREKAISCRVDERVHWCGQIAHADMPDYLTACDIFIRPSRSEGMGNSFVEAMAARLPVIATQVGGLRDFIFDADQHSGMTATAFAVPPDNPDAIVKAVYRILDNPHQTAQIVETAARLVRDRYDWDIIAEKMLHDVFSPLTKVAE